MTQLDDIALILPPPASPLEIPSQDDWTRCEAELCRLPSDFKDFVNLYGTGVINDFLWVFNPAAENEYLNLMTQSKAILAALEETASKFPDEYPMPRFPASGGFLPFAGSDNGDNIFWITEGEPNTWTIAVMGPRSPECSYHPMGIIEFLRGLLRREFQCSVFPNDFPDVPPLTFRSTLE